MDQECTRVTEWLKTKGIIVPVEWVEQCIQFVKEILEETNLPATFENVTEKAFEQWTLADLRELQEPVFPKHLATAHRIVLPNVYCVQVNSIVDISTSAYNQHQKCLALEGDNTEIDTEAEDQAKPWEPKPTRMLSMELTDGLITVKGIEDRPIPVLRADLPPGFKIRLRGRIESRKGILFMGPENVDVLGGNVETLVEDNALSKILKRKLSAVATGTAPSNKPEDLPHTTADQLNSVSQIHVRGETRQMNSVTPLPSTSASVRDKYDENVGIRPKVVERPAPSWAERSPEELAHISFEDEFNQINPVMAGPTSSTAFSIDYGENDGFPMESAEEPAPYWAEQAPEEFAPIPFEDDFGQTNSVTSVPLSDASISIEYDENVGIRMKVVQEPVPFWAERQPSSPAYPHPPVFTTFKDKLANMQYARGPTVATVRGLILGIGQKLSVNGGKKWSIAVVVNDGTMMVQCEIDNDLITRLLNGYTSQDAYNAKKRVPPDAQELIAIEKAMERMHHFLSSFDGLIQLEFYPSVPAGVPTTQHPVIKNFRQFNENDLSRLRTQVMKEYAMNSM